jgi:hypothetical protein
MDNLQKLNNCKPEIIVLVGLVRVYHCGHLFSWASLLSTFNSTSIPYFFVAPVFDLQFVVWFQAQNLS